MKSTGIVRKVDELGRIVIPKELRKTLEIEIKDPLEIFVEDQKIILRKFETAEACRITGEITATNKTLANGNIVLSPKGAEQLLKELKESFNIGTNEAL